MKFFITLFFVSILITSCEEDISSELDIDQGVNQPNVDARNTSIILYQDNFDSYVNGTSLQSTSDWEILPSS